MEKKGEITLTFNWIYAAVLGALILIGASYFIINMKNEAKENFYGDAKKYVYNFMKQENQIGPAYTLEIVNPNDNKNEVATKPEAVRSLDNPERPEDN